DIYSRGFVRMDDVDRSDNRAAGGDHVVKHQRDLPHDWAADEVRLFRFHRARPPLVDDTQRPAQMFLVMQGPLDAPFVGTDDDEILLRQFQRLEVFVNDGSRVEVIDGYI